ncbi:hypothetical protein H5T56_01095 [Candidatus Bipolaricaulota bacterium]|nr:hypothetical protein [Candidatus Bipolaricaulota bacterium]
MKIAIIGMGYVGLTTAVALACVGHRVVGVEKLSQGLFPFRVRISVHRGRSQNFGKGIKRPRCEPGGEGAARDRGSLLHGVESQPYWKSSAEGLRLEA